MPQGRAQTETSLREAEHFHPCSIWQLELQPSPEIVFPSSQASPRPNSVWLFPQVPEHVQTWGL